MPQDEQQPEPAEGTQARGLPPPIQRTPEQEKRLAEFDRMLGPAFVAALNAAALKPKE